MSGDTSREYAKARAYQSVRPNCNRILARKWEKKIYEMHRERVKSAKAMVDHAAPPTYIHMHLKLKKLQTEVDRRSVIEKDNRVLVEKISHIMRSKGLVDNWNNYTPPRDLRVFSRQREQLQIAHENRAIMWRLELKQPCCSNLQWMYQNKADSCYSQIISKYQRPRTVPKRTEKPLNVKNSIGTASSNRHQGQPTTLSAKS